MDYDVLDQEKFEARPYIPQISGMPITMVLDMDARPKIATTHGRKKLPLI